VTDLDALVYLEVRNNYFADETKVIGAEDLPNFIAAGGWDKTGKDFYFSPQKESEVTDPGTVTGGDGGDDGNNTMLIIAVVAIAAIVVVAVVYLFVLRPRS